MSAAEADDILNQELVEQVPVTAVALPFLLGLVSNESCTSRDAIVEWMATLSSVFGGTSEVGTRISAAIEQGLDVLTQVLHAPLPFTRSCAAGLLGHFVGRPNDAWRVLNDARAHELEMSVRNDELLSMALLSTRAGRAEEALLLAQGAFASADDETRCAAAHGWLAIDAAAVVPREHLMTLLPGGIHSSGWWACGTPSEIVLRLTAVGGWDVDAELFNLVRDTAVSRRGFPAERVLGVLMDALFPGGPEDAPARATDLDDRARRTFEILAVKPDLFRRGPVVESTQMVMHRLLLPSDSERIRRWLDGADRRDCVAPGVVQRFDETFGGP